MKEESYDYLVKVLMVGESGVGKTCLIQRFIKNEFSTNHLSTIAIDFKMKLLKIRGSNIKMQIWDTAGQERFNTLTSGFFKGSDGIILTYSVIDKNSFENIHKWMVQVKSLAPTDVKVILVGNKSDFSEEREITYEEGKKMADKYNLIFFETSAKSGENVQLVFKIMGEEVREKIINNPPQIYSSTTFNDTINQSNKKKCC